MRRTLLEGLLKGRSPKRRRAPTIPNSPRWRKRSQRAAAASLGRSLAIRHVDAGSCNGCELEIHALGNAFYDLERFGLRFVASPRHADALLVTGPVTRNMREALERTYAATPAPKWVIASGACAKDGHVFAGSYAIVGGDRRSDAGRSPHPRLPAETGDAAEGAAGAAQRPQGLAAKT